MRHERWELDQMKSLPLAVKIIKSQLRIREWVEMFGLDGVYISFSGGKDSTVLLDICRQVYPDMRAAFANTGLEFPEIRAFVKTFENVDILKPKMRFDRVIKEYGWNYPSKDVAECVYYARKGSPWAIYKLQGKNNDGTDSTFKRRYVKWAYLLDAPFKISAKCCKIMKEDPFRKYEKATGRNPIMGTMAEDSQRRTRAWLQTGCNSVDSRVKTSKPLSFWTESDVLEYITERELPYCSVYGDIMKTATGYMTTGEERTGCMFCPVGCHLDKENRFQRMKRTHPTQYAYCMDALGLGAVLDWLGIPK